MKRKLLIGILMMILIVIPITLAVYPTGTVIEGEWSKAGDYNWYSKPVKKIESYDPAKNTYKIREIVDGWISATDRPISEERWAKSTVKTYSATQVKGLGKFVSPSTNLYQTKTVIKGEWIEIEGMYSRRVRRIEGYDSKTGIYNVIEYSQASFDEKDKPISEGDWQKGKVAQYTATEIDKLKDNKEYILSQQPTTKQTTSSSAQLTTTDNKPVPSTSPQEGQVTTDVAKGQTLAGEKVWDQTEYDRITGLYEDKYGKIFVLSEISKSGEGIREVVERGDLGKFDKDLTRIWLEGKGEYSSFAGWVKAFGEGGKYEDEKFIDYLNAGEVKIWSPATEKSIAQLLDGGYIVEPKEGELKRIRYVKVEEKIVEKVVEATPDKATPDKATPDKAAADKAAADKAAADKAAADKAAADKAAADKAAAAKKLPQTAEEFEAAAKEALKGAKPDYATAADYYDEAARKYRDSDQEKARKMYVAARDNYNKVIDKPKNDQQKLDAGTGLANLAYTFGRYDDAIKGYWAASDVSTDEFMKSAYRLAAEGMEELKKGDYDSGSDTLEFAMHSIIGDTKLTREAIAKLTTEEKKLLILLNRMKEGARDMKIMRDRSAVGEFFYYFAFPTAGARAFMDMIGLGDISWSDNSFEWITYWLPGYEWEKDMCKDKQSKYFVEYSTSPYATPGSNFPMISSMLYAMGKRTEFEGGQYNWTTSYRLDGNKPKWFPDLETGYAKGYLYKLSWYLRNPFTQRQIDDMSSSRRSQLGLDMNGSFKYKIVIKGKACTNNATCNFKFDGEMESPAYSLGIGKEARVVKVGYQLPYLTNICIKFVANDYDNVYKYDNQNSEYPHGCIPMDGIGVIKKESLSAPTNFEYNPETETTGEGQEGVAGEWIPTDSGDRLSTDTGSSDWGW